MLNLGQLMMFSGFNGTALGISVSHSNIYLAIAVLTIGVRHGFDFDHLATIDAITRTLRNDRTISRLTGLLFSFGHGMVVTLMSLIVGGNMIHFKISHHFKVFGSVISIVFLIFFGLINLYTVFRNSANHKSRISNMTGDSINRHPCKPLIIFGIGALFALSFDTLSQITLLAMSASTMGGWLFSLFIGVLFMMGMMIADGLNGLLVAHIICRSDKLSIPVSRIVGAGIAVFSLATGGVGFVDLIT